MHFQKFTAILPELTLEKVIKALMNVDVTWVTVCKQRGHGEYRNYFVNDCMSEWVRVEILIEQEKVKDIVDKIVHAAYEGIESDGMIAVETVDEFIPIKEFKEL